MDLSEYFERIESLEFQVQFSVLSGFRSLREAMSRDETLQHLLVKAAKNPDMPQALLERIRRALEQIKKGAAIPGDESIFAYLYCLLKVDIALAHKASRQILDIGGLWWSVQLSLFVQHRFAEFATSIDTSTVIEKQEY